MTGEKVFSRTCENCDSKIRADLRKSHHKIGGSGVNFLYAYGLAGCLTVVVWLVRLAVFLSDEPVSGSASRLVGNDNLPVC